MAYKTLAVVAAPLSDPALKGKARVVKEGTTNRYITEDTPVTIALSPYYLRKLNAGELVEVGHQAVALNGNDTIDEVNHGD